MAEKRVRIVNIIAALLSASAISVTLQLKTSNMITGIVAIILYYFYTKQWNYDVKEKNRSRQIAAFVTGMILTIFMCMHTIEYLDDYYELTGLGKIGTVLCIAIGYECLFYPMIRWIYTKFEETAICYEKVCLYSKYKIWLVATLLIFLCWLPFFLKSYPAIIITDSIDQIGQAISGSYSNHHPVVQTWILQFFLKISIYLDGKLTTGIAAYCILQMLVLAAIYAYLITECYVHRVKKGICICFFLFYAIMPYNIMYAINIWKDSLFSGGVLLFSILLWKLIRQEESRKYNILLEEIFLVISGCIVTLFRNNGFYAFLIVVPFVCVMCWKKNKHTVGAIILVIVLTVFIRGPIFNQFNVRATDAIESLSIPVQQIARTIANGAELTVEEQTLLKQVIDISKVEELYDENVSDPIKNMVRESNNQEYLKAHKSEYLQLWISLGMRYPMNYMRAFLHQTEGYWYPDVQRWVYAEDICDNSKGIVMESKLPAFLTNLFGRGILWGTYTKIPIYGLFWSIGMAVWLTFILVGYCFSINKKKEMLLFLPILTLWGTLLLATPVNGEFRYLYAIFICLPFYMMISKINN